MKLSLIATTSERRVSKTPAEVFTKCPHCGSKDLIRVDTDLICGACPWNSCKVAVDAGLMDHLFTKAIRIDHGGGDEIATPAPVKIEPAKIA